MIIGSIFAMASVLVAAISQILLKKAANRTSNASFVKKFMNITVITAYSLMMLSSVCGMMSLRYLELNITPVFQATSFFWILVLSRIFLKEKIEKQKIISISIIFVGIIIYLL